MPDTSSTKPPYDPAKLPDKLNQVQRTRMIDWLIAEDKAKKVKHAFSRSEWTAMHDDSLVYNYTSAVNDGFGTVAPTLGQDPLGYAAQLGTNSASAGIDAAKPITSVADFLAKLTSAIFSLQFWIRVLEGFVALTMVAIGLAKLASGTALGSAAESAVNPLMRARAGRQAPAPRPPSARSVIQKG